MSIKGFSSQKKSVSSIPGFTDKQTQTTAEFVTVSAVQGDKIALDVAPKYSFAFASGKVVNAGSTTRKILSTGHSAVVGDFIRFTSGALNYIEAQVLSVPDVDTIIIATELNVAPSASDTFDVKRAVTPTLSASGTFSSSSGPIQIKKNGVATDVTLDTATPTNNVPIPVEIVATTGTPINITAGDINVQLTDVGVNYDATRIGDGTNLLGITASNEARIAAAQLPTTLGTKTIANSMAVNIASDQTLQTKISDGTNSVTVKQLSNPVVAADYGLVTNTVMHGLSSAGGGAYVDVKVNPSGSLETNCTQSGAWILGANSGVDIGDVTINNAAGAAAVNIQDGGNSLTIDSLQLPTSLGQLASASSLSVVLSTSQEDLIGALTEAAPGTDTASSGLNGRLQRVAQRLTSLIGLFPASLGQKSSAASLAAVLSTEQEALIGALTETAPATDTASSGLNGRLQRVAQRITSLIALVPVSLGQKTMADSFAVTIASDQSALPAIAGRAKVAQLFNDYTITSITTGAYVQLTASTPSIVNKLEIFDSSGETLILAVGGAGTEVDQFFILPGGNGPVDLTIPASSRISIKAKTATANLGYLAINLYS